MEKRILAILDGEEGYAYRLTDYICEKTNLPFQVYVFTDREKFISYAETQEIECLLIAEAAYGQELEHLKIPHIIILSESGENLNKALHHINKYQSCETIFQQVMKYYTDYAKEVPGALRAGTGKMRIIGIYTPVGRCLQTTFSLTLGQMLARRYKTLYLNFEIYSGFARMLNKEFGGDISDLMYYFSCAREKLLYRIESMVETVNGLDFIPPAQIYQNLAGIRGNQWIDLFQEIEKTSDYEFLILDLSDGLMDLWDVLRSCEKVYTITRGDALAVAKLDQYEKILESMEYGDICAKTAKWQLPVFRELPQNFQELTYGELAQFIRRQVYPDLFGESGNESGR